MLTSVYTNLRILRDTSAVKNPMHKGLISSIKWNVMCCHMAFVFIGFISQTDTRVDYYILRSSIASIHDLNPFSSINRKVPILSTFLFAGCSSRLSRSKTSEIKWWSSSNSSIRVTLYIVDSKCWILVSIGKSMVKKYRIRRSQGYFSKLFIDTIASVP